MMVIQYPDQRALSGNDVPSITKFMREGIFNRFVCDLYCLLILTDVIMLFDIAVHADNKNSVLASNLMEMSCLILHV